MNFDPVKCEEYVRMLIDHDEVERALLVLENVPAHIRDKIPKNLSTLRNEILYAMCTPNAYHADDFDLEVSLKNSTAHVETLLRGILVRNEVERYNALGIVPHIVDLGPGEYNIPVGLKQLDAKFTYFGIGLDKKAKAQALPIIGNRWQERGRKDQPTIFVANEIIEHLPSTQDIVIDALRNCEGWPERVHLSTPCYAYDLYDRDFDKRGALPHLRAYTPDEFLAEVSKLFRGYEIQLYNSQIMSIRGCRPDKPDSKSLLQEK